MTDQTPTMTPTAVPAFMPALPYSRTLRIGNAPADSGRRGPVYVQIEIANRDGKGPELSISGTAPGSCGQIRDDVRAVTDFAPGWTPELQDRLLAIWEAWHLNGMRAGCPHQTGPDWQDLASILGKPCPVCGYQYGSAWLYEPLPAEIIAEVCAFPDGGVASKTPERREAEHAAWRAAFETEGGT